jgi:hypothetical protein
VYDSVVLAGTLNSAGGLLDRGGLIRRLSEAKEKRLCWRFCGRFEMIGFGGSGSLPCLKYRPGAMYVQLACAAQRLRMRPPPRKAQPHRRSSAPGQCNPVVFDTPSHLPPLRDMQKAEAVGPNQPLIGREREVIRVDAPNVERQPAGRLGTVRSKDCADNQ